MKNAFLLPLLLISTCLLAQDWAPFKVSDTLVQYKDDSTAFYSLGLFTNPTFRDAHAIQSLSVKSNTTQSNQTVIVFEKGYNLAAMGDFAPQLYGTNKPLIKGRLLGDSLFVSSDSSLFKTIDSSGFSLTFPHSYALNQSWKLGQSETHTITATTDSLYNSSIAGLGTDSFAQVSLTVFNMLNQRDTSHKFDRVNLVISKSNGLIKTVDFCDLDTFRTVTFEKYQLPNQAFTNNDYHTLTTNDEYHYTTRKSPWNGIFEARQHISKIIGDTTIGNFRTITTEHRWRDIYSPNAMGISTIQKTFSTTAIRHNKKSMIINDSIATHNGGLSQTLFHTDNHNLSTLLEYNTWYYVAPYFNSATLNTVDFVPFESGFESYGPIGFPYSTEEFTGYTSGPENKSTIQEYIKKGNQTWGTPFTFTVGLTKNTALENKVSIYPNPASNFVQIYTDLQVTNLRVLSLNGQLISESMNTKKIDVENLKPGLYVLRITATEGTVTKRLVIK
ncbi:T9SS type A sorting domain-containing protein [bacterium]|nr:T9SS type A sorting domain-containing protein [bacterium]